MQKQICAVSNCICPYHCTVSMNIPSSQIVLFLLTGLFSASCHKSGDQNAVPEADGIEVVVKKRDDGTISSVNQVDDQNKVHGARVTYYADGKTVYSRTTFTHGIKNGPFIRYYRNGQAFEHTSYAEGEKDGLTRKYYMSGQLMAEFVYDHGIVQPGLKEYTREGTLVTTYPEIIFNEENHLATHNRIDLIMSCSKKGIGVKYYLLESSEKLSDRIYLISERGSASMEFYVKPGETIDKIIRVAAEIPTELGNVYVRTLSYHLNASH